MDEKSTGIYGKQDRLPPDDLRWFVCDACGQRVDRSSLFEVFEHTELGHTPLSPFEIAHVTHAPRN